jgi:tripartite-type tricarboxylate transporter receptor subunit TctC
MRTVRSVLCLAALYALSLTLPALAQSDVASYPNRPIRIVVAFAAGGGNDIIIRIIAQKLQESLGQQIIIENRPGANAITGTLYAKNSPADGYTLLMGATGAMAINPAVFSKLPYDSLKDFVPLSMLVRFPLWMVATPTLPVKNVQELLAYAKANPAKANYATSSTPFTLAAELLKQKTNTAMEAITYKSSGESVTAVMSGQVLMTISDGAPVVPQIKAGRVRALAVTGKTRSAELPDVPTLAEAGVPGVEIYLWTGLLAPAGTPPAIVKKLEAEIIKATKAPDVVEKLKALALDVVATTGEDYAKTIAADIRMWTAVAKAANIKMD